MIKFGTGGWRGIIGEDFMEDNIRKVAEAVAIMILKNKEDDKAVAVGYDNRNMSLLASHIVASTLTKRFGISVFRFTTPIPTPLLMNYVKEHKLHYGVMITASHNPNNYNGIKLIVEEGRDASKEITDKLEAIMYPQKDCVEIKTPWTDYIRNILQQLNIPLIQKRKLKVIVDPMCGSGALPIEMVLKEIGCEVDMINNVRQSYSSRVPTPSAENLTELSQKVVEGHYDLGIALDGDGDRLGIIDKNGKYITPNEILCLLYFYLLKYKGWKGPVVRNYATTHRLDKIAEAFGEKCYEVPVGFKYISAKMDEVGAILGGESSGGLTVRGHIHGKDGVYAAALFVEMLSAIETSVEDILSHFGSYVMVEENIKLTTPIEINQISIPFAKEIEILTDDNCTKYYFKNGEFLICRKSGTEPVLRIFAEAATEEKAKELIAFSRKYLKI